MTALISTVGIKFDDFGTPAKLKKTAAAAKQTEKSFDQLAGKAAVGSQKLGLFGKAALGVGASSSIGAVGVKALGTAIKSTFAPLLALSGAVAGLGTAFGTLKEVEFAAAKVKTLGTDSSALRKELQILSLELNQQVSTAELMSGAYDVASAGFTKASDAAKVLKAASLGATGGFSDLNTVGNATTSVLNAYGKSADKAMGVVDQFIQTQNDGKIIVAEYAQNIGKVASVAATMKVPLKEVNAAIALTTAAGVKAEVAFTGMKTSLLRLGGEAGGKKLEKLGIDISAATIEAEGLLANLKKLEGLDITALESIFGQEAIQVMAPILKNLEKYEQLIKNQENSAGAAADAQATAANTIQGAWTRVVNAFQNLFADQNELGVAIKITLQGISAAVDVVGAAFKMIIAPVRLVLKFIQGVSDAIAKAFGLDTSNLLQKFTDGWNQAFADLTADVEKASEAAYKWGNSVVDAWRDTMERIKLMWQNLIPNIHNATPQWLRWLLDMSEKDMPIKTLKVRIKTVGDVPGEDTGSSGSGSGSGSGPKGKPPVKDAKEYATVLGVIKDKWGEITDIVAGGLTNAVMGLIDGTKSLGESLAGIAKSLASMFLQAGFKSLIGGIFPTAAEGAHWGGGFKAFAKGGVATGPTLGLVGEAGEDEYVIPSSKMQGAMERYSAGARGQAVIPGGGTVASGSGVSSAPTTVNYTGPVLSFNSEAYVPKSAIPEIINSAARRGAQEGQSKVMSQLKNSRSQRSRIGL